MKALQRGTIDLLPSIGFTKERESVYDFSRDPVFIDSGVLFTNSRAIVHTVFDLKGKKVAALDKSVFTEAFRSNLTTFGIQCEIVLKADNQAVMAAIVSGQVDAGVCIYSLGTYLSRSYPVVLTPISFSPIALVFATPKGQGQDLLAVINREMGTMRTDPTSAYSLAYKKWTQPPDPNVLPLWIWGSLGALIFFGLLLVAWNLSLNRVVKRQTHSLLEEKERLAVTLASIADGVITSDVEEKVQLMNPVAERLCGWGQSEAAGRPVSEVFVVEGREGAVETSVDTSHVFLVSRNGSRHTIAESQAPILAAGGQVLGTVRTFRDVTEREQMLETIQRTDKLDALGVLAGGIAHDFNNLLAGIFGFIELARKSDVGPKASQYLDKAQSVFARAKSLSHQLLTFSKGGAPTKKPTDLIPLIRASAAFAGAGSNVRLELDLPPDLSMCDVDENQMGQVFDNLIINARQAMPHGGRLQVAARNLQGPDPSHGISLGGRLVCITLTDEGVGISLEQQPKVFDPFFTTKAAGHGLGLATCNSIVHKHGGILDFQSTLGRGTTFRIVLPALEGTSFAAKASVPLRHRGSGVILIMDDEAFLLEILSEELKSLGYEVVGAANGQALIDEALPQALAKGPLKAAFMDLTIPGGLGGREVIAAIRADHDNLPIFASSGFSDDPVMAEPTRYGFTSSIRKPYRTEDLIRLLNRFCVSS